MATKLFVGKLSFDTVEQSLNDLFAQYGKVTRAVIIIDRQYNRSKGFGFVEMPNDDEAKKAIAALDGQEFEGQKLTVSVARPREESSRRESGFRRSW